MIQFGSTGSTGSKDLRIVFSPEDFCFPGVLSNKLLFSNHNNRGVLGPSGPSGPKPLELTFCVL